MEDFIVSARKYRPTDFESVVGQENITQTLLKAIENNHLAQAFLFCGPRGVGKTTCARILARTVNAHSMGENADENTDYSFNIFELDAASNNSVDDIRNLIDQVRIPPQIGKYKVYIIDEVHMLSTSAFNAFLKTLEEPPAYAIFILATTEKHKVLPTIISRCQVFDFNRIQVSDMVKHLAEIAEKEGVNAENDALHIIAEKADGALRDALSIFDQIVGFAGKNLTYKDVITNLNILDHDYYFDITNSFLADDKTQILLTLNTILNNGFDGHNFINGLANHFRNILFCTSERTAAIMEVGETVRERYLEQSKKCDPRFTLNALNILSETDINYKSSKNSRLLVELCLLKISSLSAKLHEKKNTTTEQVVTTAEKTPTPPSPIPQKEKTAADLTQKSTATSTPTIGEEKLIAREPHDTDTQTEQKQIVIQQEEVVEKETIPQIKKQEEENISAPIVETEIKTKLGKSRLSGMPSLSSLGSTQTSKTDSSSSTTLQDEEPLKTVGSEKRPVTDFNLEMLWEAWNEYAQEIKSQDRLSYYTALTTKQPIVREKYKVEILVKNHIQKSDLDEDKSNLLNFLREKLKNFEITLEGIIDEDETTDDHSIFDPSEKYKAMVEINPTLANLKTLFNLDVDYDS